jgi:flagellar biosynthesis component FlhA
MSFVSVSAQHWIRYIVVSMIIIAIMFFPVANTQIDTMMDWWWFRLAWLVLIVLVVVSYRDHLCALLTAVLFVMAANVSHVRYVSKEEMMHHTSR